MANAPITSGQGGSTAYTSGFTPELWSMTALNILRAKLPMLGMVLVDGQLQAERQGNKVHFKYAGAPPTVTKRTDGDDVTLNTPQSTSPTVELTEWAEASFLVTDVAAAQASADYMGKILEGHVYALARQVNVDLLSVYDDPAVTQATAGTADIDLAKLNALELLADGALWPDENRYLVLGSAQKIAMRGDADLLPYFQFNQGQQPQGDVIRWGGVPQINGFDIRDTQLVAGKNLAFQRGGIACAFRLPPPADGMIEGLPVKWAAVQDPQSGVVVRTVMTYNGNKLGPQVTVDLLYGFEPLRPELIAKVPTLT